MARRALVDMKGTTGAHTREKSCEKPHAGHRHGGGLDEETTNTQDGRWQHLKTGEGGKGIVENQSRTNTTHKKKKMTHRPVHSPVLHRASTGYPGRPPALF